MANTLLNVDEITNAALVILHQKLNFVGSINRSYDDSFGRDGAKIGNSLRIRLPNQFTVSTGQSLDLQDVQETNTTLTVATQKHVDTTFSSAQLELNIFDFSQQVLEPAMAVLAANIEADAMNMLLDVYQVATVAGSPQTFRNVLQGQKLLTDALAPMDSSRMVRLDTQSQVDLVDGLKGLFQASDAIKRQYSEGVMGRSAGFEFATNTLLPTFLSGSHTATYQVNGANQTGTSLIVDTGTGTVLQGDTFTIANVFRVHPETKLNTNVLQQFVVTAASAGGGVTLSVLPAMIATGPYQTINALPADNALITFTLGVSQTTQQSIAYHKDAFAFAGADLPLPDGVHFAARKMQDGLSLRIVRQYDINTDRIPARIDMLYGYKCIRPQLAARLFSN